MAITVGPSVRPRLTPQSAVRVHDRYYRMLCLLGTVLLGSARSARYVPGAGIDPSWVTALNIASGQRLDFGRDVVFMYGPLGFLDIPLAIHLAQLAAGFAFYTVAIAVLWFALDIALSQGFPRPWASVAAMALAVLLASYSNAALELLIAAPVFAVLALRSNWGRGWVPACLAVSAAGLIQVKFTDGVFVGLFAVLAAGCSGTAPVRRFAEVSVAFGAALLLGWTLAGQSLADLWPWFTASLQISLGYSDALTSEMPLHTLPYILAALLAVVVIALAVRWTRALAFRPRAGVLAIMLAALYIGFKEGFIRHEPYHQAAYFSACVPLLAVLVTAARHRSTAGVWLLIALVFGANSLAWLNPFTAPGRWSTEAQLLLDAHYRNGLLNAEATRLRSGYAIPPDMLAAVGEHPVAVDPWESSVAWAYSLHYHPVPMFQTFSAYTKSLDERNAKALRDDPSDQKVLRQPRNFGQRNQLWSSPQYTLTLACRYSVESVSPRWMLLQKATNRCGRATTIDTEHVRAGQVISVPVAGANQIVLARFTPGGERIGNAVVNLVWKDVHRLYVTTDGVRHVLARRLASRPLIMSMPQSLGWPANYQIGAPYHQISFSTSGRLQFQIVPVQSAN